MRVIYLIRIRQPKQINLTDEDNQYQLDYWAALFKSTTWEDLKMLAPDNEYIRQASETIYQLSQEEAIRQQCEAREDYYRRQKGINDELTSKENTIIELQGTVAEQKDTIEEQNKHFSSCITVTSHSFQAILPTSYYPFNKISHSAFSAI